MGDLKIIEIKMGKSRANEGMRVDFSDRVGCGATEQLREIGGTGSLTELEIGNNRTIVYSSFRM